MVEFHNTVFREPSRSNVVKLPRRDKAPELGCSREEAVRKFVQNQISFTRKGQWTKFEGVVQEYAQLKHSELVPAQDLVKVESDCFSTFLSTE